MHYTLQSQYIHPAEFGFRGFSVARAEKGEQVVSAKGNDANVGEQPQA